LVLTLRPLQVSDSDYLFGPGQRFFLPQWLELQQLGSAYTAVAELDGHPVGRCGVNFTKEPGVAWIWAAHVDPGYQSQGVGTALLQHLEELARERGFAIALGVGKDNPDAERLYQRLGYRRYSEEVGHWSYELDGKLVEESEDCWLMKKMLC
jgi:ribosomal protein S18 acetylase RimI-like enzyme